ncbi:MAG TPA: type II toxin-antitoxin system prevent-host-death family antitoxin [Anaeromyxobacteraceae bacterium]|jgi:antitoxin (DNA-binding transcriptional repressor) of toxin-antitoxin stability system|nr:type II toxin-antitoxin system prevent-host-death family antitoxin [Anaeromyxobacteraceae bacterium]
MKIAGIRELKAHLSAYVRDAERGEVVLVTDRGQVVAELRPPGAAEGAASPAELRYRQLVERGALRPAANRDVASAWQGLGEFRLPRETVRALLAAEREE